MKRFVLLAVVAFLFGLMAISRVGLAEDWPQFRGPTGQGISGAKNVPVEWDAAKNVGWKIDVPGRGWSSPVVVGDRIYLTTAVGENTSKTSLRAMCFDVRDGKVVWDNEVFAAPQELVRQMHQKNSPASATPLVDGDRLYVHFGHMGTAAMDLAGKVLWRKQIKYPPVHGNGGSPVLADEKLIFNCDGAIDPFVIALDASSGAVKWKTPRNSGVKRNFSFATPLVIDVSGKPQVVSPASGMVAAYDPHTGAEIWRVRWGGGYSVIPRPEFAQGIVVASSGYDTAELFAVRVQGAQGDATNTNIAWRSKKGAPNTPSPLIVGGAVYNVGDNGIASCIDLKTGKVNWTQRLDGNFSASPVGAEGRVYFQNESGVGFVVRADPSKFEQLAENDLGERSLASYAVGDGVLFIRTGSHLWKISH
jgi:outer membrane protein assembly factor BamB